VGARFSAPVQTGPGAHTASYTMGTGSLSGVDHPPSSSARVKERVEIYVYSPSGSSWPLLGRPLPLPWRLDFVLWSSKSTTCTLAGGYQRFGEYTDSFFKVKYVICNVCVWTEDATTEDLKLDDMIILKMMFWRKDISV
jgi:hypothetical protein